jgi:hypothetical protein
VAEIAGSVRLSRLDRVLWDRLSVLQSAAAQVPAAGHLHPAAAAQA